MNCERGKEGLGKWERKAGSKKVGFRTPLVHYKVAPGQGVGEREKERGSLQALSKIKKKKDNECRKSSGGETGEPKTGKKGFATNRTRTGGKGGARFCGKEKEKKPVKRRGGGERKSERKRKKKDPEDGNRPVTRNSEKKAADQAKGGKKGNT